MVAFFGYNQVLCIVSSCTVGPMMQNWFQWSFRYMLVTKWEVHGTGKLSKLWVLSASQRVKLPMAHCNWGCNHFPKMGLLLLNILNSGLTVFIVLFFIVSVLYVSFCTRSRHGGRTITLSKCTGKERAGWHHTTRYSSTGSKKRFGWYQPTFNKLRDYHAQCCKPYHQYVAEHWGCKYTQFRQSSASPSWLTNHVKRINSWNRPL